MIAFWIAVVLTVAALVMGGLSLRDAIRKPDAPNGLLLGALSLAAVVALMAPEPPSFFLKGGIGLTLLLLLVAEGLGAIPGTPRVVRYGTNVALYFLLWLTLFSVTGRALWSLPGLVALLPLLLGAGVVWLLRAKAGDLLITAAAYAANAALALGGAAALVATRPALWSGLALGGVLLFALADLLPAWDRWRSPVRRVAVLAQACTLLAALLLAWAVWGVA